MTYLMKIGDLAKQTGLSIRTLHYYDEIGLLSPSHRTDVGYRLYNNQDIIRLQQIVSLRQLGFSLKEIHECLKDPDLSLQQTIDLHRARVQEQMSLSRTLLKRLDVISTELQTTQSVAVDKLIQVMETVSMSKQQYFTPEQQEVVDARFRQLEVEWQELLNQIRTEMDRGTDFNNPKVQNLAWSWRYFMQSFLCGDWQIYDSLVKSYQQDGAEAESFGAMDAATFEYMLKAVSFLSLSEDLDLVASYKYFSLEANRVIRLGQNAVIELNLNLFGTEGMLLGFLAEGSGIAARVLKAAGVNFEAVKDEIVRLRHELAQWEAKSKLNKSNFSPTIDDLDLSEPSEFPVYLLSPAILESIFSPLTPPIPNLQQIPFTSSAKRVLELARQEAKQIDRTHIDSGHLLLGILREEQEREEREKQPGMESSYFSYFNEKWYFGLVGYLLEKKLGIDLEELERQLRLAMTQ